METEALRTCAYEPILCPWSPYTVSWASCKSMVARSIFVSMDRMVCTRGRYPGCMPRHRFCLRDKRRTETVKQEDIVELKEMTVKIEGYKRVAKHNHWDETLCLANVYFYLNGTALKWFENNEETIRNWEEFTTQLESVFGKSESLRLLAEKKT
ncbi:hypothetical protein LAZ67_8004034 [Cordylochernes scorpioides]|uniref:Retrotransposon gag domain-containing protein n=1 Tax=Cordylochernes scorpioides TaxID=51811 RepID=A0ABY6KS28_9ARAC|nr:hypothetical protein LAZ67_8004034 [Cordylochernes scorpioides]